MSTRYPGGIINQTAPVPSGSFQNSTATGVWTLEQQAYFKQQGLWPIPGNINTGGFIENLFQTWLYTGTGAAQPIGNGIPLGNASSSQFSLVGYTVTNLGAAFNSGFPMRNLTDGIVETTNAANLAYVAGSFFDVYVDLVNPAVVTAYNIAPQGTANTIVYNTPQAFIVKASNDASTWTTIATFTGISTGYPAWNAGTFRVFSFSNTTAYRYWRLENTVAGVAISEWNLTGTTTATVKGGLVWLKNRTNGSEHWLADTVRGPNFKLSTNSTGASTADLPLTRFNANGFTTGPNNNTENNASGQNYASWTFAEQPKFFDIVTWSGNTTNRDISHNLGSVPGMIIVKKTSSATNSDWWVWHRSISTGNLSANNLLRLNLTNAQLNVGTVIGTANSTSFQIGDDSSVNLSGQNYIAYLFAHNAGGFGISGEENVVSCGSFTTDGGGNATINLGYEPQWLLLKRSSATSNWAMQDTMRGWTASTATGDQTLYADLGNAETSQTVDYWSPTATGFTTTGAMGSGTYIYMAIRKPMAVPTVGTSVFFPDAYTEVANPPGIGKRTYGFAPDVVMQARLSGGYSFYVWDKLRGLTTSNLVTASTVAEGVDLGGFPWGGFDNTGATPGFLFNNADGDSALILAFRRASGFFDQVCYTGNNATQTISHNLAAVPELMLVKRRNASGAWRVYVEPLGNTNFLGLNETAASVASSSAWSNTSPTSTVFTVGNGANLNASGGNYVNYLFATLAGVSKVGSYTGTGATQTINCGFTTGARFVLIKRTDSTGNWWTWDTGRGMVSGTDPRLTFNTYDAQVNNNWVFTTSTGFQIVTTDDSVNASGGSYIFLAIA
jgi:hypothetical protein